MLTRLNTYWKNWGFEICILGSIVFILLCSLLRINKEGSWSTTIYYNPYKLSQKKPPSMSTNRQGGTSKGEIECKRVLETYFNKPFPKCRPDFLRNPVTGGHNNLEIDCYNDELKLGCEYSGRQHYEYVPFMHKNKEAFYNQKYRDDMKKRMCKDNGIVLIEVSHKVKNIEQYLINEIKKYGY